VRCAVVCNPGEPGGKRRCDSTWFTCSYVCVHACLCACMLRVRCTGSSRP
jgi:hypothetical protein